MSPDRLFGFAERCNPKRAFLFVSRVLGRHVPVSPALMRATYRSLAAQIPAHSPGPCLVTGMAETAIGLGAGIHQEYAKRRVDDDTVFLATTRHPLGGELLGEFQEEHSHATRHLLHRPTCPEVERLTLEARTLILVDDEVTTGKTFVNLYGALQRAGLCHVEHIYLVTLTDWSEGEAAAALPVPATPISLLFGRYRWRAKLGAVQPVLPDAAITTRGQYDLDPSLDWGRLGTRSHARRLNATASPGERVLVLGTGEYVWRPYLLAEKLESYGATVHFSATTRSPIVPGHAIRQSLAFTDDHGLGIANYVYNLDPTAYDRMILCTETSAQAIDPVLIQALSPEILCDSGVSW